MRREEERKGRRREGGREAEERKGLIMPAKTTVKMSVHRNRGLATLSEGERYYLEMYAHWERAFHITYKNMTKQ